MLTFKLELLVEIETVLPDKAVCLSVSYNLTVTLAASTELASIFKVSGNLPPTNSDSLMLGFAPVEVTSARYLE